MGQPSEIRIALAQVNPTVGAVSENRALVADWVDRARVEGADLVVFPELVLSGYPPDDLVFRVDFLEAVRAELEILAGGVTGIIALVGFPEMSTGNRSKPIDPLSSPLSPIAFNSAAVLQDGEISEPFASDSGWHILLRMGSREQDVTEQLRRNEAREAIGRRKAEDEYERFLRQLRDEAYVETRLAS